MKQIILASASPRRKELLKLLDLPFTIKTEPIEEIYDKNLPPHEIVMYLSQIKAKPIADKHPNHIVIGADTIVVDGMDILGKPRDQAEAYRMIHQLSNHEHSVLTGVSIYDQGTIESFYSETTVRFYSLTDEEIKSYIATDEPYDKAGAYALQGMAAKFIHSIHGDHNNVIGLPIGELYHRLKKYL